MNNDWRNPEREQEYQTRNVWGEEMETALKREEEIGMVFQGTLMREI